MSKFDKTVAIPKNLQDFIRHKDKAFLYLQQAEDLIAAAESELNQIGPYVFPHDAKPHGRLKDIRKAVDIRIWQRAFDLTGFGELLDREAKTNFHRDLERQAPEFTEANIRANFMQFFQQKDEFFIRGLVNVFRKLCGHYKTNQDPFKVPAKVILTCTASLEWRGGLSIRYGGAADEINDLDRVFKVLDGQKHQPRALESAINAAWLKGPVFEDDYYQFKGYKNGNAHVKFKRQDLLDKANELIAGWYQGNALGTSRKRGW